ncbi:uncharacterized protein LOC120783418 isoform X2 [Xiphias gladius]|uniref:uncharacterized protein LOC120783418 isoform X2 n=1 Tax=Xiphias gladius TaxID=8245 RepID=UPI001A98AC3B|nr:uncharacterized protein LOC120783418 isoform X2 [Xiphias gladius]
MRNERRRQKKWKVKEKLPKGECACSPGSEQMNAADSKARVSLDGYGGSMTSWRCVTCLFLFVFLIDLSKEDCFDYFNMGTWEARHLTRSFPLARAKDSRDLIECTLEKVCNRTGELCHILHGCFKNGEKTRNLTCEVESSQNVSFYHLMCLTAKALNHTSEGCGYENVCRLHSEITSVDQTTLPPPPAAPTTLQPTITTLQETRTATTAVLESKVGERNASSSKINNEADAVSLKNLLIISVILNVVLPLAVYLWIYMRTQHRTERDGPWMDPGAQPMTVLQPTECDSVVRPSADSTRNGRTFGNGLPH